VQHAREGAQSAKEKRARAGAAARWHPSAALEAPARRRGNVAPHPKATRSWRVGESEREPASLRQYKSEVLLPPCCGMLARARARSIAIARARSIAIANMLRMAWFCCPVPWSLFSKRNQAQSNPFLPVVVVIIQVATLVEQI